MISKIIIQAVGLAAVCAQEHSHGHEQHGHGHAVSSQSFVLHQAHHPYSKHQKTVQHHIPAHHEQSDRHAGLVHHAAPAHKKHVSVLHSAPIYHTTSIHHAAPAHHGQSDHHAAPVHKKHVSVLYAAPIYHPAPIYQAAFVHNAAPDDHKKHHQEEEHHDYAYPKYEFAYKVEDPHTGDRKPQHESRDGDVVKGVYSLHEADGSVRTVQYDSENHTGFNAYVKNSEPMKHIQPNRHAHQ